MNHFRFEIADLTFAVQTDITADELLLPRFSAFAVTGDEPDIDIILHRVSPGKELTGEELLGSAETGSWLAERDGRAGEIRIESDGSVLMAMDFGQRRIDIFFGRDLPEDRGTFRIGAFPFSVFLHEFDGLMLHCSAVDCAGRSAIFLGPDEGGKTTAAGLMKGCRILADDMVLMRRGDHGFRAWGTPWTSFEPFTGSSVPGGLFLLEKAGCFSLEELPFSGFLSHIWSESDHIHGRMPPGHRRRFFDLCCDLAGCAPAWKMMFPLEGIPTGRILEAIGS